MDPASSGSRPISLIAEFLLGALSPPRTAMCVDCGVKMGEVTHEDVVKAVKELILNGYAMATHARCVFCDQIAFVTRLRQNRGDAPG